MHSVKSPLCTKDSFQCWGYSSIKNTKCLSVMGFDKNQKHIISWDGMIRAMRKDGRGRENTGWSASDERREI